jgi:hypothetical protein
VFPQMQNNNSYRLQQQPAEDMYRSRSIPQQNEFMTPQQAYLSLPQATSTERG